MRSLRTLIAKLNRVCPAAFLLLSFTLGPLPASAQRIAMNYRGAYAGGTTYQKGDSVASAGVTFVSLISNNTGNTPASNPSDWYPLSNVVSGVFTISSVTVNTAGTYASCPPAAANPTSGEVLVVTCSGSGVNLHVASVTVTSGGCFTATPGLVFTGSTFTPASATAVMTPGCGAGSPTVFYSAAGTPLPTCNAGDKGTPLTVKDATTPTYMGAYSSGGAVTAAVLCSFDGASYAWLTH